MLWCSECEPQLQLDGAIHVWRIDLTQVADPGDLVILSPKELASHANFKFKQDAERYWVAHVALRRILASYLLVDPCSLKFELEEFGKPKLVDDGLTFNLSHTRSVALLAVSKNQKVGVDVEPCNRSINAETISKRFFTAKEHHHLQCLSGLERQQAFFRLWVMKEAFVKAVGCGLSGSLAAFEVDESEGNLKIRPIDSRWGNLSGWFLHQWCLDDLYFGAVVSSKMPDSIGYFDYIRPRINH